MLYRLIIILLPGIIAESVAFELIDWQDETHVLVKSFTRGDTTYTINLEDSERGAMVDCSC
ncbi:hypothetical protein BJV82DRAFT_542128, partial [Fennellomyces sp. T-0311]